MKRVKQMDCTNPKSIKKMIAYLEEYKKTLESQCVQFCNELADVGIKIAISSTLGSRLGDYVVFSKEFKESDNTGCEMIMYGRDIKSLTGEGEGASDISPILMMEYGSGKNAVPFTIVDDLAVGRGTFPGQTHAFAWTTDYQGNPFEGWWYKSTKDGKWHLSSGTKPSYPMQKAYDTMQTQVDKIARKVFRLPR